MIESLTLCPAAEESTSKDIHVIFDLERDCFFSFENTCCAATSNAKIQMHDEMKNEFDPP